MYKLLGGALAGAKVLGCETLKNTTTNNMALNSHNCRTGKAGKLLLTVSAAFLLLSSPMNIAPSFAGDVNCAGPGTGACTTNGEDDIVNGTIDADDLASNSVNHQEIATDAVRTDEIKDGAVTGEKLNANVAGEGLIYNNGTKKIDVNAGNGIEVTGDKVKVDLGDASTAGNSKSGLEFKSGDLVADVDDNSIEVGNNGLQIKDQGVKTKHIKDKAVTNEKLANNAVTTDKIKNNTILSEDIKDGTIGFVDLAPEVNDKIKANMMATIKNREDIDKNTQGIALAMAIANAPIVLQDDQQFSLSLGMGFFDSETAGAIKGAMKLAPNTILSGSVAFTEDEVGGGFGVGFGF